MCYCCHGLIGTVLVSTSANGVLQKSIAGNPPEYLLPNLAAAEYMTSPDEVSAVSVDERSPYRTERISGKSLRPQRIQRHDIPKSIVLCVPLYEFVYRVGR